MLKGKGYRSVSAICRVVRLLLLKSCSYSVLTQWHFEHCQVGCSHTDIFTILLWGITLDEFQHYSVLTAGVLSDPCRLH